MTPPLLLDAALAASITHAASKQTYYTVRFLVDKDRVADAYRAYAYFRWVDDWLDAATPSPAERLDFLHRQQALLAACSAGRAPAGLLPEEHLLADLLARNGAENNGLHAYTRNMMAVMAFDAERRGRLVSRHELEHYTHWLAVAVTEALHYFIGHHGASPHTPARYRAATGAHIAHMLRDAVDDAAAGYYNLPAEIVTTHGISPEDVDSRPYRAWVRERLQAARACFYAGRSYLARVENFRCRLAGYAYIQRFEGVLDAIQHEGYRLRIAYPECKSVGHGLHLFGEAFWLALDPRRLQPVAPILPVR